jgi:hypothetical protein
MMYYGDVFDTAVHMYVALTQRILSMCAWDICKYSKETAKGRILHRVSASAMASTQSLTCIGGAGVGTLVGLLQ